MTVDRSYPTPRAFRQALTDKLKARAAAGRWSLQALQRQMAYDRLLERLYRVSDEWILKGAAALLARDIAVRATVDIDLYRQAVLDVAEEDVRNAAALDIGDWFRFEMGNARSAGDGGGRRLPVTAFVGATPWCAFHVDITGEDRRMTGQPEPVPALVQVVMPELEQHGYRAYPIPDHIADKIAAILERHGPGRRPSSRYKDLVDLVAIVTTASVPAPAQLAALASEAQRRELQLPPRFAAPERTLWERGYAAEARRSFLSDAGTLDKALALLSPFVDALLDGTAHGTWNPETRCWE